jgi:pSer/pThr/pTyr-binding forkhead associated (FHA) protein
MYIVNARTRGRAKLPFEGVVQIDSQNDEGEVLWTPVLDIGNKRYSIDKPRTIVGRSGNSDITLNDSGASRQHVELLWDGNRAQLRDLTSTNGTRLNGERVRKAIIEPGSIIQVGRTHIFFRVVAQEPPQQNRTHRQVSDATFHYDVGEFWRPSV